MGLIVPFDPAGMEPKVAGAFEDLIATLQAWAGSFDSLGKWVDVPYDAGLYRAVTGTWTVGQGSHRRFRYALVGAEMMVLQTCIVATTTSAGIGNDIRVSLPQGFQFKPNAGGIQDSFSFVGACEYNSGATSGVGLVYAGDQNKAPTQLRLLRDVLSPSTNWPAGVTDLTIAFCVTIPVVRT